MKICHQLLKSLFFTFSIALSIFSSTTVKAQYTINNVYGNLTDCDTMTRGIYIVWWDKDFNYATQVSTLLDSMVHYRSICLNNLYMMDPPNPLNGFFYNIYIHTPGNTNDIFNTYGWGNGQGTDSHGYPFLTLPNGVLNDWVNNSHETFHIFQYSANAPGFAYSGSSQWFIEASANWFAAKQNLTASRAFVEAESLVRVPQVPLWLSYDNFPSSYPSNWQRYVHQYAMALFLFYLTDIAGEPDTLISKGFYSGTNQLPQEYLFNRLGGSVFRNHFIDWAAHMLNDFDFITPTQAATNLNEWNNYADAWDDYKFIQSYNNTGSNGWYHPADTIVTNAWAFNTYKLLNNTSQTYTFEIKGDTVGSYGTTSYFQGKLVVENSITGASYHNLNMSNYHQGALTINLTPTDTSVYFIIASMPNIFTDSNPNFQLFPYSMRISIGNPNSIINLDPNHKKTEIARYNFLGQKIKKEVGGFQIVVYDDGSTEKIFTPEK